MQCAIDAPEIKHQPKRFGKFAVAGGLRVYLKKIRAVSTKKSALLPLSLRTKEVPRGMSEERLIVTPKMKLYSTNFPTEQE